MLRLAVKISSSGPATEIESPLRLTVTPLARKPPGPAYTHWLHLGVFYEPLYARKTFSHCSQSDSTNESGRQIAPDMSLWEFQKIADANIPYLEAHG